MCLKRATGALCCCVLWHCVATAVQSPSCADDNEVVSLVQQSLALKTTQPGTQPGTQHRKSLPLHHSIEATAAASEVTAAAESAFDPLLRRLNELEDTNVLDTCQGDWPLFRSSAELSSSNWGNYFQAVYGEIPQDGYPICIGEFWVFYQDELEKAGVELPDSKQGCPSSVNDRGHYETQLMQPPWQGIMMYQFMSEPHPDNTWVEVCHRARSFHSKFERHGAWFGTCTGSGIYVNTGRTIHFDTHPDGFKYFGATWENDLAQKAAERGYDTVQFMKGDGQTTDDCCTSLGLGPCCHAHEFVSTKLVGSYGCAEAPGGTSIRAGWRASRPCNCNEQQDRDWTPLGTYETYINCEGVPGKIEVTSQPL